MKLLFIWTIQIPSRSNEFIFHIICSWIFSFPPEWFKLSYLLNHGGSTSSCSLLQHFPNKLFASVCLTLHYICLESDTGCSRQIILNLSSFLFLIVRWIFLLTIDRSQLSESTDCSHAPFVENKTSSLWRLLACSSTFAFSGEERQSIVQQMIQVLSWKEPNSRNCLHSSVTLSAFAVVSDKVF